MCTQMTPNWPQRQGIEAPSAGGQFLKAPERRARVRCSGKSASMRACSSCARAESSWTSRASRLSLSSSTHSWGWGRVVWCGVGVGVGGTGGQGAEAGTEH